MCGNYSRVETTRKYGKWVNRVPTLSTPSYPYKSVGSPSWELFAICSHPKADKQVPWFFSLWSFIRNVKHWVSCPCFLSGLIILVKVRIFWEGHKIRKNLPLKIWRYSVTSHFKWKIFSNFVAFSEYPNFNRMFFLTCSWRFLISNNLEQLQFKLEKNIGI